MHLQGLVHCYASVPLLPDAEWLPKTFLADQRRCRAGLDQAIPSRHSTYAAYPVQPNYWHLGHFSHRQFFSVTSNENVSSISVQPLFKSALSSMKSRAHLQQSSPATPQQTSHAASRNQFDPKAARHVKALERCSPACVSFRGLSLVLNSVSSILQSQSQSQLGGTSCRRSSRPVELRTPHPPLLL